jgi:Protein of unknown function (DUF3048) N-terminal domain/Protein of unknown function (DUF3048) C-terminal domain
MKFRRSAALVLGATFALTAAACGGGGGDSAETTVSETVPTTAGATTTSKARATTTAEPTTTAAPLPTAPMTGLPVADPAVLARPALAVKMDNHPDARPHVGLNQADIVYEEIVEGITRFFVVFQSTDASPIGPVRSARTTDVDLLNQLNRPLFAWSGGNRGVVNAIGGANAESRAHGQAPGFYRDEERRRRADLEHTLMNEGTPVLFSTAVAGQGTPPQMFQYLAEGESFEGEPAGGISTRLNSVPVTWIWDAATALWIRSEYNDPHVDILGEPISSPNVIFQFCDYRTSPADPGSPEAVTVGSGEAWIFADGQLVKGRWDRPSAEAPATFTDADGDPVKLTPGRTWIELAEAGDTEVGVI